MAKAGRPPRSTRPASFRFAVRLTAAEHKRWQAAADKVGVTLSVFVRDSVEAAIR